MPAIDERALLKAIADACVRLPRYGNRTKLFESDASRDARLVYADWLEENGRILDAAKQRQKAGVCEVRYQARWVETGEPVITGALYRSAGAAANALIYRNASRQADVLIVAIERTCRDLVKEPLAEVLARKKGKGKVVKPR